MNATNISKFLEQRRIPFEIKDEKIYIPSVKSEIFRLEFDFVSKYDLPPTTVYKENKIFFRSLPTSSMTIVSYEWNKLKKLRLCPAEVL